MAYPDISYYEKKKPNVMEYPDISHYESKIPQEMNQEDGGMLSNIGNYLYEGAGKFNKMHNTVIRNPVLKALGGFADIPNLAAQGLEGLGRGQAESERRKFQMMGLPGSDIETPEINALSSNIRSEEHTSELQSHHDLVCRLLLEKKKKRKRKNPGNRELVHY